MVETSPIDDEMKCNDNFLDKHCHHYFSELLYNMQRAAHQAEVAAGAFAMEARAFRSAVTAYRR